MGDGRRKCVMEAGKGKKVDHLFQDIYIMPDTERSRKHLIQRHGGKHLQNNQLKCKQIIV